MKKQWKYFSIIALISWQITFIANAAEKDVGTLVVTTSTEMAETAQTLKTLDELIVYGDKAVGLVLAAKAACVANPPACACVGAAAVAASSLGYVAYSTYNKNQKIKRLEDQVEVLYERLIKCSEKKPY